MYANRILAAFLALGFMASCHKTKDMPNPDTPSRTYAHGAYILCEGNFGWGEGSVFYYDTSQKADHELDAYRAANGFTAGNVVESMLIEGDTAYLVVNNSNKVEALATHSLRRFLLNSTLTSPRYLLPISNNQLAITDLYASKVSILDRGNLSLQITIPAPGWTEQLCLTGGKLYVANRKPTQSDLTLVNEQILVINPITLQIEDSIKLNGQGSQELIALPDGRLVTALETDASLGNAPSLVFIDPATKAVEKRPVLQANRVQPTRTQRANDWLFWLQGDYFCYQKIAGGEIKALQPFDAGANLSSLRVLNIMGSKARILMADARKYTSKGLVKNIIIDLSTGAIEQQTSVECGPIPGQIVTF